MEIGDTLEDSLVREVREETGFTVHVGRPIHAWIVHLRLIAGWKVPGIGRCYECSTRARRDPRLDPHEHTELAWVAPEEVLRYPVPPNQLDAIRKAFAVV